MIPGSPDYLAIKVGVIEGMCAQRVYKKGKIVSDPDTYVRMAYYGNKWETQIMKNNIQPKWSEVFEIPIPLGTPLTQQRDSALVRSFSPHQTGGMRWASLKSGCGTT
jgi:hypothetical protein